MSYNIEKAIEQTAAVLTAAGAKEVYIFGSAAKGTMKEGSDMDFAIAGLPPQEFFKALSAAGRSLPMTLDLIDLDEATPFTRYLKKKAN